MQTINLKFEKLDRLPVPESRAETLWIKQPDGNLIGCFPITEKGGLCFPDVLLHSQCTYAHVKVTATETDFKVGDRVKMIGGYKEYIIQEILDNVALLQQNSYSCLQLLTDLTLIPNE